MASNYLKIPNAGTIATSMRILYEMQISDGYADANGYFTKRDVAEIAANALLVTTGGSVGGDVVSTLDMDVREEDNPALQNVKQSINCLRMLGLISADYDSEIYAITKIGSLINPVHPDKKLLMELFMNICSCTEIYDPSCDKNLICYPGYQICYSLASLDYQISGSELPMILTYDISEVKKYVEEVSQMRAENKTFTKEHPHYLKTQKGTPIKYPSNQTRFINQILRYCDIIEHKQKKIGRANYYVCTEYGKQYCNKIKDLIDKNKLSFLTPYDFRRKMKIPAQKQTCLNGMNNLLLRSNHDINEKDNFVVFSPYQMIPETNICWLMEEPIRKHPEKKDTQINAINNSIGLKELRLKAIYNDSISNNDTIKSDDESLVNAILQAKTQDIELEQYVNDLCEQHKCDDKSIFYPFVHSLLRIIGLNCSGEIGRYDAYCTYKEHVIPAEIKSYTETPSYNLKGLRQGIENKICSYNSSLPDDLGYASFVIGFAHPQNDAEIRTIIDTAKETYKIKIIATDIYSLAKICVSKLWHNKEIDLENLLQGHGLLIE